MHHFLIENGFSIEHENVFYASTTHAQTNTEIQLHWHPTTAGRQRYCDFIKEGNVVGGCEIQFLEQETIAYLRWFFINQALCGKGIGSECMSALTSELLRIGIVRFDTDTACSNNVAQHFYKKNGFVRKGITRSYYTLSAGE